jgi:hypothetical protein
VSALRTFFAKLFGSAVASNPEGVPEHEFPRPNSPMEWSVGVDRCWFCLTYDPEHTLITDPPCTRKRPALVELA